MCTILFVSPPNLATTGTGPESGYAAANVAPVASLQRVPSAAVVPAASLNGPKRAQSPREASHGED